MKRAKLIAYKVLTKNTRKKIINKQWPTHAVYKCVHAMA